VNNPNVGLPSDVIGAESFHRFTHPTALSWLGLTWWRGDAQISRQVRTKLRYQRKPQCESAAPRPRKIYRGRFFWRATGVKDDGSHWRDIAHEYRQLAEIVADAQAARHRGDDERSPALEPL
jgi:hypothetical protein